MKKIRFKLFIYLLSAVTVYAACHKADRMAEGPPVKNVEGKFFSAHASNDPLVQSIAKKMQRENQQQPFIETIIRRVGYPQWDKSMIVSKQNDRTSGRGNTADSVEIVYIPFVRDSQNYVNASLLFKVSPTDTSYQYLLDWQYESYGFDTTGTDWNAKDVFHLFANFDRNVFGRTAFQITDDRLFGAPGPSEIVVVKLRPQQQAQQRADMLMPFQVCSLEDVCYGPAWYNTWCGGGCTPDCEYYTHTESHCTTYWIDDGWVPAGGGNTGGTGGTGGGTTGGGSGGGGGYTPPQCPGVAARAEVVPNCSSGWVPVGGGGAAPSANQTIIDSLQGYPCAQGVLSTIAGINVTTKNILATVFDETLNVNIVFIADSTLPTNVNGYSPGNEVTYSNGIFSARVHMPPYILKNSSKEFIAKTMYHEAIHAYLTYRWRQYRNHEIDSNTFKILYPQIWKYQNEGDGQHVQMAETYVNNIKDIVLGFNPAISDSVNRAISWGGLTMTKAWKNLGSDTFQLNRLRNISRDSSAAKMLSLHLKKCN